VAVVVHVCALRATPPNNLNLPAYPSGTCTHSCTDTFRSNHSPVNDAKLKLN
jgi:hypothetical protein